MDPSVCEQLEPAGRAATTPGHARHSGDAPARRLSRPAQARAGAGVIPERAASARSRRPLPRAGFEVIGLAADDAELRGLVERSRRGAGSAGVPMLPWSGDGAPQAAEASQLRPPEEAGILVLSPRGHARYALERLTDRERDVLALMAEGRSNSGIASQLFVTEHTVEKHVKNIFSALRLSPSPGDHRRVLAVLIYLRAVAAS